MEDGEEPLRRQLTGTWYDSRRGKKHRDPEYRLYYPAKAEEVIYKAQDGDTLFLCCQGKARFLPFSPRRAARSRTSCAGCSGLMPRKIWKSGISQRPGAPTLDFAARYILDELGIETEEPEAARLDRLIEKFGLTFPIPGPSPSSPGHPCPMLIPATGRMRRCWHGWTGRNSCSAGWSGALWRPGWKRVHERQGG